MARQNKFNSLAPQAGDYKQLVVASGTEAPLLEYLISNVKESRNKIKATLQGRGIKVNGKVVTQFDLSLKVGDKVSISRHKSKNTFKSQYVKVVYEDRWLVVIEKNIGILSMAARHF